MGDAIRRWLISDDAALRRRVELLIGFEGNGAGKNTPV